MDVVGAVIPMIFFIKLKGDIYRYMTEVSHGQDYQKFREHSETEYKQARDYYEKLKVKRIT